MPDTYTFKTAADLRSHDNRMTHAVLAMNPAHAGVYAYTVRGAKCCACVSHVSLCVACLVFVCAAHALPSLTSIRAVQAPRTPRQLLSARAGHSPLPCTQQVCPYGTQCLSARSAHHTNLTTIPPSVLMVPCVFMRSSACTCTGTMCAPCVIFLAQVRWGCKLPGGWEEVWSGRVLGAGGKAARAAGLSQARGGAAQSAGRRNMGATASSCMQVTAHGAASRRRWAATGVCSKAYALGAWSRRRWRAGRRIVV